MGHMVFRDAHYSEMRVNYEILVLYKYIIPDCFLFGS
jgi:hypothetical protein